MKEIKLPIAPSASRMWTRVLIVTTVVLSLFLLDRLSGLLLNNWLLDSMGYVEVFWVNFQMQATLFLAGLAIMALVVAIPAWLHGLDREDRLRVLWVGALAGVLVGYWLNRQYLEFLVPLKAVPFGEADPIFGNDISFYVFDLPPIVVGLVAALVISLAGLIASISTALVGSRNADRPEGMNGFVRWLGRIGTPFTSAMFFLTGLITATLIWLRRYGLLTMPNWEEATEGTGVGAGYVDLVGFFSTKNSIYVEALAVMALAIGMTLTLIKARKALRKPGSVDLARAFSPAAFAIVLLPGITTDLVFRSAVGIREQIFVIPNEPVIQLPYLQRHIDATNTAFGLDDVEEKTVIPAAAGDPLPDLDRLLESPTIKNPWLWSEVARYSKRVAPQYVQRILLGEGDMNVFSPTLQILDAQQLLRPYYGFMDVDTIATKVDGELTLFASAARELPQDIMRQWLLAWGQRSFLFTHGHGLIAMHVGQRTPAGDPVWASSGIPVEANIKGLEVGNPAIYYGEGTTNVAYSNAVGIDEHDVATEQGRIQVQFPRNVAAGIKIDSFLKRLVVGYQTRQILDVVFSTLIGDGTRAHIFRRPIERIEQLAPFIDLDTDPYAFPTPDGIKWMVNAITSTNAYPYSARALFGDISEQRMEWRPLLEVNYVADSVKAVVDAVTGHVDLYQFSDEPVIATWAATYPTLFKKKGSMPADVRSHVQYPQELMSIQFNLIYPFYHQRDALTFYSGEDLWDDADEVMGPILGERALGESGEAITFSQALFWWIAEADGLMVDAKEPVQLALSKSFTPEGPLNLRAVATVYQTGEDYGKLSVLKVPKGLFLFGPEQADAAIDQDSFIAQEIGLWNRLGVEVIRGRTSNLFVGNELIYVEPIFIRSRQNPVPQLQRVVVLFRGRPHMGRTLEEALTFAVKGGRLDGWRSNRTASLAD